MFVTMPGMIAACACAATAVGAAVCEERHENYKPLLEAGKPIAAALGTWRSRGYGWILQLGIEDITVFHVSAAGCSRDPRTTDFSQQFAFQHVDEASRRLTVVQYPGENRYIFDRLERLPEGCERTGWTPTQLFEHFAASYREQYAFFEQRGLDWAQRVAANRPLVSDSTSPRVLFAIFSDMLDQLEDGHVSLNATFDAEPVAFRTGRGPTLKLLRERAIRSRESVTEAIAQWQQAYDRGVREIVLRNTWREAGNGRFLWGRVDGDIGYLNVSAVEGFTSGPMAEQIRVVNELMERILADFSGVRAVIVDITNNLGGYDRLAREIAGRFAVERTLAYSKRPYGVEETEQDVFYTIPSNGRRFTGPTYLLTSDVTVSGAEILAMTMRVLPNVTQIGTATRGALSDRLTKMLPDGSDFSISNEIYLDPAGRLFEAVGVPPHRPLEIFPSDDLQDGHAKAVARLIEQIRNGTAGRN